MATVVLSSTATYDTHALSAADYPVMNDKYRGAVVEASLECRLSANLAYSRTGSSASSCLQLTIF